MPPRAKTSNLGKTTVAQAALQQLANSLKSLHDVDPKDPPIKPHPGPQLHFINSRATITVFGGQGGGGKLLSLDTPIPTRSGWTTMEDVRVGDEVFDDLGVPCLVTAVFDVEVPETCYRLTFDDGSTIDAGADHLWHTFTAKELDSRFFFSEKHRAKKREGRKSRASGKRSAKFSESLSARNRSREYDLAEPSGGSVRSTQEIFETITTRRGRKNHAIRVAGSLSTAPVTLPMDPYVLGAWLGDGTSTAGAITSMDAEIIDVVVSRGYPVRRISEKAGNKSSTFFFDYLCDDLKRTGVFGNKRIPQEYLRSSFEQRLALLRGLMDTDGTVAKGSGSAEFCTTSQEIADGFYELVCSLGWKVRRRESRARLNGQDCGPKWTFKWMPSEIVFSLERKARLQRIGTRQTLLFRYVSSCEKIESVPMRCISVDSESRLYLAGRQMVPTHNSFALHLKNCLYAHVPGYSSVMFRRISNDLRMSGGLWPRAHEVYPLIGGTPREDRMLYTFPSGATVQHQHMEHEKDRFNHRGGEYCHIAFDEVQDFTEDQFWFLMSRNRSKCGVTPFMSATCLDGGTYLQSGDGRLVRIDRCEGLDGDLLAVSVRSGSVFRDKPTHFYRRKTSSGKRIVTNQGEITCTADHRLFVWAPDGPREVAAEDIRPGQYLASIRSAPHGTVAIDPEESYLVGYTVGDGGISGRKHLPRLFWTEHDKDHARLVASIAGRVLDTKIGVHKRTSDCYAIYVTSGLSSGNRSFISRYHSAIESGLERSIPEDITAGNEEACRRLLQGVFDAEGSVGKLSISFSVTSWPLAQQVLMLLRRWSIVAAYRSYDPKLPRRRVHQVNLSGRQAVAFVEHIGFRNQSKQEKAIALVERLRAPSRRAQEIDSIPIDRAGISHLSKFFGKSWWNKNKAIRLDTALSAIRYAEESGLDPYPLGLWSAYSWQKVARVEDVPLTEAFDVTIPSTHVYAAASLLSHNCNPDPDSFIAKLIEWWIDPDSGFAIPERSGIIRWMVRADDSDTIFWGDTPEQARIAAAQGLRGGDALTPMSFTFIHSSLADNPTLLKADPLYLVKLQNLPKIERERLLGGNWHIRPSAGTIFNRDWFNQRVSEFPKEIAGPMVRGWDLASSATGGDRTASVKGARGTDGRIYVQPGPAFRESFYARDEIIRKTAEEDGTGTFIEFEQDPGGAGKEALQSIISKLTGFVVKHSYVGGSNNTRLNKWKPAATQAEAGNIVIVDDGTGVADDFVNELHNSDGSNRVHDDWTSAFATMIRGLGKAMTRAIW